MKYILIFVCFFLNEIYVLLHAVLVISLLSGANLVAAQLRSLFDYPASALSLSDLEGQEAELSNVQTSRYSIVSVVVFFYLFLALSPLLNVSIDM